MLSLFHLADVIILSLFPVWVTHLRAGLNDPPNSEYSVISGCDFMPSHLRSQSIETADSVRGTCHMCRVVYSIMAYHSPPWCRAFAPIGDPSVPVSEHEKLSQTVSVGRGLSPFSLSSGLENPLWTGLGWVRTGFNHKRLNLGCILFLQARLLLLDKIKEVK